MVEINIEDLAYNPVLVSILVGLFVYVLMYLFYDTTENTKSKRSKKKRGSREYAEEKVKNNAYLSNDNEVRVIVALVSALITWIAMKLFVNVPPEAPVRNINDDIIDIRPNNTGLVDIRNVDGIQYDGNTNGMVGNIDDVYTGDIGNKTISETVNNVINNVNEISDNVADVIEANNGNSGNNVSNNNITMPRYTSKTSNNTMRNVPRGIPKSIPRIPSKVNNMKGGANVSYNVLGGGLELPQESLQMF